MRSCVDGSAFSGALRSKGAGRLRSSICLEFTGDVVTNWTNVRCPPSDTRSDAKILCGIPFRSVTLAIAERAWLGKVGF
ncbi:Hypothetical protein NTJ_08476 [Nesidiocoris tenuis]|uniref:SRCR domain-containing protein n=1 Tax=Nesidiocoris tenuis TaxID=355587 RepID=A0ABN7ATY7_9HEMI|nr:Hypothetical protein NTJ_08476 [Nesidiocoris tenuis]